jgi:hypothetical protein
MKKLRISLTFTGIPRFFPVADPGLKSALKACGLKYFSDI